MNRKYQKKQRKLMKMRRDFGKNAAMWIIVCSFLFFINITTSPGYIWAKWPFFGWGLSIFFQAIAITSAGAWKRNSDDEDPGYDQNLRNKERYQRQLANHADYSYDETLEPPLDLNQKPPRKQAQPQYWNSREFV